MSCDRMKQEFRDKDRSCDRNKHGSFEANVSCRDNKRSSCSAQKILMKRKTLASHAPLGISPELVQHPLMPVS